MPLAVIAAIWLAHGIVIGFSWDELMDQWGIINQERFTRLAVLGVVVCGIVAVLRVLRGRRRDEDED